MKIIMNYFKAFLIGFLFFLTNSLIALEQADRQEKIKIELYKKLSNELNSLEKEIAQEAEKRHKLGGPGADGRLLFSAGLVVTPFVIPAGLALMALGIFNGMHDLRMSSLDSRILLMKTRSNQLLRECKKRHCL